MVTQSKAHAARQSPVPGVVVVVLAVAAILFGVAFVRRSETRNADLNREFVRVRAELEAAQTAQTKLARRLNERLRELEEQGFAADGSFDDSLAGLEFEAEVTIDGATEPQCETSEPPPPAEVLVLTRPSSKVTSAEPTRSEPVPAQVAPVAPRPIATRVESEKLTIAAPEAPAPEAAPADSTAAPAASLDAARAAAAEHAELLAPFFAPGREQPDGSRTTTPGPMSWSALAACGALVAPTEEALEANPGLRKLAEIASNSPNDRPLWPYTRGSRARVWYLRGDGRARVPLAQALLREHGEAFVALGLLAP